MTAVRALGVIPARGGSKRLPRKNSLPLFGAPVVAWTIEAASKATRLTDWLLTTDDPEIAEIGRRYGAPVPFMRPPELATDTVRNADVLVHALEFMERQSGSHYDIVLLLQPTCPIRSAVHIDQAVEGLAVSEFPTLASVRGPYKKHFPTLKRVTPAGVLENFAPIAAGCDWEPFYIYNAAIYAIRRSWLLEQRSFISPQQVPLAMDEFHSTDIDTMSDLVVAEARLRFLGRPAPQELHP